MHLAGRCTGCGECQRACPVGIPILALRQQIARAVAQLFDGYQPGLNPDEVPPLLGYEVVEKNIHGFHIARSGKIQVNFLKKMSLGRRGVPNCAQVRCRNGLF